MARWVTLHDYMSMRPELQDKFEIIEELPREGLIRIEWRDRAPSDAAAPSSNAPPATR